MKTMGRLFALICLFQATISLTLGFSASFFTNNNVLDSDTNNNSVLKKIPIVSWCTLDVK